MSDDNLQPLRQACEGLLYPSETDAPLEVFLWKGTGPATARAAVEGRVGGNKAIEEVETSEFFDALEDSEDAPRFRSLQRLLCQQLVDVTVLRAGARKIDIYLIGRTHAGDWAGVHTVSVET